MDPDLLALLALAKLSHPRGDNKGEPSRLAAGLKAPTQKKNHEPISGPLSPCSYSALLLAGAPPPLPRDSDLRSRSMPLSSFHSAPATPASTHTPTATCPAAALRKTLTDEGAWPTATITGAIQSCWEARVAAAARANTARVAGLGSSAVRWN
jgi:hypothetical protein